MTNNRGMALFIVLGMFFIIILLGNVALGIISSQARLTHHSVSRIQAVYASQAATNLALERLRTGVWAAPAFGAAYTRYMCRSGGACPGACDVIDGNLPVTLAGGGCLTITVLGCTGAAGNCPRPNAASGNNVACVKVKSDYTYVSP